MSHPWGADGRRVTPAEPTVMDMNARPFRHLCYEADERDAMDDGDMDASMDVGVCETTEGTTRG